MTLPRADVPPAFCERFCCAWRGRCDPMTARPMGHNAARSARDDEGKRVSGANPLDQMVSQ